jgi:tRNA 2-thiouridine synthesizing protein A
MPAVLKLDATGVKCPIPVIRTKKALRRLKAGDILEVNCTDPMANIDIPCLLFKTGDQLLETLKAEGMITLRIQKA